MTIQGLEKISPVIDISINEIKVLESAQLESWEQVFNIYTKLNHNTNNKNILNFFFKNSAPIGEYTFIILKKLVYNGIQIIPQQQKIWKPKPNQWKEYLSTDYLLCRQIDYMKLGGNSQIVFDNEKIITDAYGNDNPVIKISNSGVFTKDNQVINIEEFDFYEMFLKFPALPDGSYLKILDLL